MAMRKLLIPIAVVAAFSLALLGAPRSTLAATDCASVTSGSTVHGGLVVSATDNCGTLTNVTVDGGVRLDGGSVYFCGSTIHGDVRGTVAAGSLVGFGEVDSGARNCAGVTIDGRVQISGSGLTELDASHVNGGVDLTNTGAGGPNSAGEIEADTISGPLTCGPGFYNDFPSLLGSSGANDVTGPVNCTIASI